MLSNNSGFSKFIEKRYAACSNVRIIGISKEKLLFSKKKSIYSDKSLFLKRAIKITYLYDMLHLPDGYIPYDYRSMEAIVGYAYLTPKEFTYISLIS